MSFCKNCILVLADFNLAGIGGTPSGVTEPLGDGVYEIAGSTFTTGSVDLVSAGALTIQAFESSGPVAITVV